MCESCKGLADIPLTLDVIPIRDITLNLTVVAPTLAVLVSVKEFVMRVLMWRCNDRMRRGDSLRGQVLYIEKISPRNFVSHDRLMRLPGRFAQCARVVKASLTFP